MKPIQASITSHVSPSETFLVPLHSERSWRAIAFLQRFLDGSLLLASQVHIGNLAKEALVLAWGRKPSALKAQIWAQQRGLRTLQVEDGFVRSWGTGPRFPALALVVDELGIYYDATVPSALEALLASEEEFSAAELAQADVLMQRMRNEGVSKYNHAPAISSLPDSFFPDDGRQRVLVVDQTLGDCSVKFGEASAQSFKAMLAAARSENPLARIYIKTHPEVSSGRKAGYLSSVQGDDFTVVLRQAVNPMQLLSKVDKVYVVSSTMGFEALLAGKPVVCFGVPWYAGWGLTDDRVHSSAAWSRRAKARSKPQTLQALFIAGYMRYTRYIHPFTKERGQLADVLDWLALQRQWQTRLTPQGGRLVAVGFRRWKAANMRPILSLNSNAVHFVRDAKEAQALHLCPADRLLVWGARPAPELIELARASGAQILRVEDGFFRSVGLGSDLIPPRSLVLDSEGIYFDATRPSELESLLRQKQWSAQDLERAHAVRHFIVEHGLSKYNTEPVQTVAWLSQAQAARIAGRKVILVPGQVEDDASILYGVANAQECPLAIRRNIDLLRRARQEQPQAFIVYKPHPDVSAGNRKGSLAKKPRNMDSALVWADVVEERASVVSCIEAVDAVYTMTSLTGFDALLRGKEVVTFGQPFYAGWGLTDDRAMSEDVLARRGKPLSLDQLVAGTLLDYPLYWDPELQGYTRCETVLRALQEERNALIERGHLHHLQWGWVRRQWRKLKVLWRGFACPADR